MDAAFYLPGKKHAPRHLGRVLVLGLGKSGRAALDYGLGLLGDRVTKLAVAAGAETPGARAAARAAQARGALAAFGEDAAERLAALAGGRFDLCIASPGIPPSSPLRLAAADLSDELVGEVEFAWRESPAASRWIAVTGTNGKTTVAALIAWLLKSGGLRARAVGNIGDPCLEAVAAGKADVYVVEASSYQLDSCSCFSPELAVLLGVTPDHLQWHGSFEAYRDAKLKVLANLARAPGAVAVLDATNETVAAELRRLQALGAGRRGFDCLALGGPGGIEDDAGAGGAGADCAFVDAEGGLHVVFRGVDHALASARELRIKGAHNLTNALAAAAAALAFSVRPACVSKALRAFAPLEHRIEPCGRVEGVACYNDSKATNVDAALKALSSFPETRVVALLGGQDKGTDLQPLAQAVIAHARAAVCFGEAGPRFAEALEKARDLQGGAAGAPDPALADADPRPAAADPAQAGALPFVRRAARLADAFEAALGLARPGEVVLLSPACASFDEFSSFEERGRAFKRLVASHVGYEA